MASIKAMLVAMFGVVAVVVECLVALVPVAFLLWLFGLPWWWAFGPPAWVLGWWFGW